MPLDPLLQPMIDIVRSMPPMPTDLSVEEMRERTHRAMEMSFLVYTEPGPEVGSVVDHRVAVDGGAITVRMYTPAGDPPFAAHLYMHGGGFYIGTLDHFDGGCRQTCADVGCVVASVDYRLAPEHRFPTAAEDSYAALEWLHAHADELGVDAARVSVGGASAGGNLAAVVALMARDRGGPPIVFQLLEIPVTDLTMSQPSIVENGEGYVLTKEGMEMFRDYYADAADRTHPYASPLLAPDLSGLPPALVMTAEFDPLRDEGEAYAHRLAEAGVPTELRRWDGQIHGSTGFTKLLPAAREHRDMVTKTLREALAVGA